MKNSRVLWSIVALVLIGAGFLVDRTILDDSDDGPDDVTSVDDTTVDEPTSIPEPDEVSDDETPPDRYSDLPTVTLDDLPSEAIDVLQLIEDGGPYEYGQDDSVFQNREGILPDRDRGHYREYTVETPGSSDRGARRIVAGADGERYWTDDHYDSFSEIAF